MIQVGFQKKETKPTDHYPRLMGTDDGLIVLFSKERQGTIIAPGPSVYKIGSYETGFNMGAFKDINGTITLENIQP